MFGKLLFYLTHVLGVQLPEVDPSNQILEGLGLGSIPLQRTTHLGWSHYPDEIKRKYPNLGLVVQAVQDYELKPTLDIVPATRDDWGKQRVQVRQIAIRDLSAPTTDDSQSQELEVIIDQMYDAIVNNRQSVYVHCKAGKGRSWFVVVCFLLKYGEREEIRSGILRGKGTYFNAEGKVDLASAMTYVKTCREAVNPGKTQKRAAQEYAQKWGKKFELPESYFSPLKVIGKTCIGFFRLIFGFRETQPYSKPLRKGMKLVIEEDIYNLGSIQKYSAVPTIKHQQQVRRRPQATHTLDLPPSIFSPEVKLPPLELLPKGAAKTQQEELEAKLKRVAQVSEEPKIGQRIETTLPTVFSSAIVGKCCGVEADDMFINQRTTSCC